MSGISGLTKFFLVLTAIFAIIFVSSLIFNLDPGLREFSSQVGAWVAVATLFVIIIDWPK